MRKVVPSILIAVLMLVISAPAWALDVPTIAAAAKGPNQINLTWAAIRNPGYGFKVEIQSAGDARYATWTDISTTQNGRNYLPYWVTESQYRDPQDASSGEGSPCQFPVYGLMNNTSYSFRVRTYAKSDTGAEAFSSYSNTATVTTANYAIRYVSTSGSNSNDGKTQATAWRNLSYAGQQATAGMVVYIMGGNYSNDYLTPSNSGSLGNKIVFQAYPGGTVTITSGESSGNIVRLSGSHVVVDGIHSLYNSSDYAWAVYGNRNAVVNSEAAYDNAPMTVLGAYNMVHNNYFHHAGVGADGNDPGYILTMLGSSALYNIAQYNHNSRGAHDTGLAKDSANYNKWLNNLMDGGWGNGWAVVAAKYNLVEGNEVADVQAEGGSTYKVTIQLSGDNNTVRRNIIRHGHNNSTYGFEISALSGATGGYNLIYNNVIYRNNGMGIAFFTNTDKATCVIANNIIYGNSLLDEHPGVQFFTANSGTVTVKNNLILGKNSSGVESPNGTIEIAYGTPVSTSTANSTLSGFSGNVTSTPMFINETGKDYHLQSGSQLIAAGTPVTDSVWGTLSYPGSKPTIGAYEYFGAVSGTVNTAPVAPKNLRIITQ